jgi:hypothetical protein
MTIKELRDNIDKIDDGNLENLLRDFYDFGTYGSLFVNAIKNIDITDYIPIPYEVCEENDNYKKESEE